MKYYGIKLSTADRGQSWKERFIVVRERNAWLAYDVALKECENKGEKWVVLDMKRL